MTGLPASQCLGSSSHRASGMVGSCGGKKCENNTLYVIAAAENTKENVQSEDKLCPFMIISQIKILLQDLFRHRYNFCIETTLYLYGLQKSSQCQSVLVSIAVVITTHS